MKLAELHCIQDITIYGRNEDGSPDHCFIEGKDYLFCVNEHDQDLFTVNEVGMVHYCKLDDDFTKDNFIIKHVKEAVDYGLDDLTLHKMKKLNKERKNYQ